MPRPSIRRVAVLVAAAAALVPAAGCGGGGDSGPDRTEGLSPDQLVQRTADAAQGLKSFRLDFEGTAQTDLAPAALEGAGTAGLALRGPIPFSGAGPVIPPDRFAFDVTAELSRLPVQANLTRAGDGLYLSALGRDFQVQVPAATVRELDARAVFPTLAGWISDPRRDGEEDVDGSDTVRLVGGVDARAAAGDLGTVLQAAPGLLGGDAPSAADLQRTAARLQRALGDSTVTMWVRKSDLLPARLRVQLDLPDGSALSPQLRSASLDLVLELSDYDADLQVTAPQGASPLDLDNLQGLLGG
ncbi:MAG: hypothetical protein IT200_12630 [Thermoleophilia bacterium]|nr:hypothetical protein [Thermoleophilia bacterium]